jgi:trigger factor
LNEAESNPSCAREIEIEIPAEALSQETEAVVARYQRKLRVPGFRQGRAPASLIRQRFADAIRADLIDSLIPRYVREQIKKEGLTPVASPQVSGLPAEIRPGEPLRFKATFEVLPQFEVSGYEELRARRPDVVITEEEVSAAVEDLREKQATYTVVEGRPLQNGDYAQISFTGTPQSGAAEAGRERQPVRVNEVLVEIGGFNTVPEFTENLRGTEVGDSRKFAVAYPADFADQRLAGHAFQYEVTVNGIKQKHLPGLDDDFARQTGECDSLAELREDVRRELQAGREREAERAAKNDLIEQLIQRQDFPVPEALVEHQVEVQLERGLHALAMQGLSREDLEKIDFGRLRAGQRENARKAVKISLILDRIAEREGIQATTEEVEREVEALARQSKQPLEEVRARLTHEGTVDRIRDRLRSEKTLDHLYRITSRENL